MISLDDTALLDLFVVSSQKKPKGSRGKTSWTCSCRVLFQHVVKSEHLKVTFLEDLLQPLSCSFFILHSKYNAK